MPGTGPAPSAAEGRRRSAAPQRGEWIELPKPRGRTPALLARGKGRGKWSPRTRRAWKAWWADPASTQWGPGDLDLLEHLADIYEEWVRWSRSNMASEVRQLRDSLGLTPKGKQDRRWRVASEAASTDKAGKVTALDDYRSRLSA